MQSEIIFLKYLRRGIVNRPLLRYNRAMKKTIDAKRFFIDYKYYMKPRYLERLTLIQMGERFCGAEAGYPEHEQICYEITYVYNGTAVNTIDGKPFRMPEGTFNFSYPSQRHSIFADKSDMRYFFLGFVIDASHPLFSEFKEIEKKNEPVYAVDAFHTHTAFLDAILNLETENRLSDFVLINCINQILCNFLRSYYREPNYVLKYDGATEIILFNMLSYLDENFLGFKNLDPLSEKLGYSPSHLSHVFSATMRKSPTAYVVNKKLEYAAQLLRENNVSPTEIAELIGYDSIHSFSKAFKKKYGVSPIHYKNEKKP